jgi:hypothetical protein
VIEDIINPTLARQLINDFYYQLPNNGFLKEGLLSCEKRYNEAIICALVCIDKMITIAPWGGVIDDEIEHGSKEYYMRIKDDLIQIQNENT